MLIGSKSLSKFIGLFSGNSAKHLSMFQSLKVNAPKHLQTQCLHFSFEGHLQQFLQLFIVFLCAPGALPS